MLGPDTCCIAAGQYGALSASGSRRLTVPVQGSVCLMVDAANVNNPQCGTAGHLWGPCATASGCSLFLRGPIAVLFTGRCPAGHFWALKTCRIAAGQCWPLGALGSGDWGTGQVVARAAQASLCRPSGGPKRPTQLQVSLPRKQLSVPVMGCNLPACPASTLESADVALKDDLLQLRL